MPRLHFLVPDRSGLPPLASYATLQTRGGRRRLVGYTEASRGCRHLCRHCPVVPIYNGQFRVVPPASRAPDSATDPGGSGGGDQRSVLLPRKATTMPAAIEAAIMPWSSLRTAITRAGDEPGWKG